MPDIIARLLTSDDPSIRYKIRAGALGEDPDSPAMRALREEIRVSPRVQTLLAHRDEHGRISLHPYKKWEGAHWVLAVLADLGYPPGDPALRPLVEQVYNCWLAPSHVEGVPVIEERARRCGSQEGNALYAMHALGHADERAGQLAHNLLRWQWPDGGWNCDRKPAASHASFHETLLPLRGLAWHARATGDAMVREGARRAAEVFLARHLFRRLSNGNIIKSEFRKLHYPAYWHYDVLGGLKVLAEAGFIADPRCTEALEWLESRRLPDGGFPADQSYARHHPGNPTRTGYSPVAWGPVKVGVMNEFVTADALTVLAARDQSSGVT